MSDLSIALNDQGLALLSQNQFEFAEGFFREAVSCDPDYADAYANLGVVLFMQNKFADAIATLERAYKSRPDHRETLVNYGHCLWRTGAVLDARRVFEKAAAPPHQELATLCWQLGDIDGAQRHAQSALQNFNSPEMHHILSDVYRVRGDEAAAMVECDALVSLDPSHRYKRSLVMLTFGDKAGWQEHEECYQQRGSRDRLVQLRNEQPYWFRKLFDKKWAGQHTGHLLISHEQGFGDAIQFLRFIPLAAERCEKLTLVLPPTLQRLASLSFNQPNIVVTGRFPREFDHFCLIMSLGYLLDRVDDIPAAPYVVAPNDYADVHQLAQHKVGLVWAGRRDHEHDQERSIALADLKPLFDLPVSFVSLQINTDLAGYPIVQPRPPEDWADTAALIQQLDLVIAVDTAVAHLAGALGKPVWLLNRYNTDWRWMLHRADTPWYPTMRIFRQSNIGDWRSVIQTVRQELVTCGFVELLKKCAVPG